MHLVALAAALALPLRAAETDFPKGQQVDRVATLKDEAQSYALYLPSNYDPSRPWPVIFLFDPGARGPSAVSHFRAAAERYGYVLVGSNNSRNGLWEQYVPGILAMIADAGTRLSLDPKRVYAAGLSGGARVASRIGASGIA